MRALVIALLVMGCKDKAKQEVKPAPPPVVTADATAVAAVDAGPIKDDRCDAPCRFLADTSLADIAMRVEATCGTKWPAANAKDCAQFDYQRNCIYANAGYTFKKKRYQATFGSYDWYKPRADFKDTDLSATATANVAALKQRAAECKKGNVIDDKDRKIVDAWLGKLRAGKPEIPAIVIDGSTADGATTADDMKKSLLGHKADFSAKKLKSMTYRATGSDAWETAVAGKAKRVVELDFSEPDGPDCEEECGYGLWLVVGIDDKDHVVALEQGMAACPFAYLVSERGPVLQGELVRNLVGAERETSQQLTVDAHCGGRLTFRIAEEKAEVTYLDELVLVVDGDVILPEHCGALCANDGRAEVLRPGQHLDVSFDTPATCTRIALRANGHYNPIRQ